MVNKTWSRSPFRITTDRTALQLDRIHRYLAEDSYWAAGIPTDIVRKSIENAICFGVFVEEASQPMQIGFARLVTDSATFAWIADVYIEAPWRGRGLSKWLMECVMEVAQPMKLRRVLLGTKDAHGLYRKFGFEVTKYPERFMEIRRDNPYQS